MFRPQDHWHKYNVEKQWIDGIGWCDMNGVKIDSNYKPTKQINKNKYYNEDGSIYSYRDKNRHQKNKKSPAFKTIITSKRRVSFIHTILNTLLYQFIFFICTVFCLMIFFENTHETILDIFAIVFYLLAIRCGWIIIKNLFERNLKW